MNFISESSSSFSFTSSFSPKSLDYWKKFRNLFYWRNVHVFVNIFAQFRKCNKCEYFIQEEDKKTLPASSYNHMISTLHEKDNTEKLKELFEEFIESLSFDLFFASTRTVVACNKVEGGRKKARQRKDRKKSYNLSDEREICAFFTNFLNTNKQILFDTT